MAALAQIEDIRQQETDAEGLSYWNHWKKIAFRFLFAYFVLYTLPGPQPLLPWVGDFIVKAYTSLWDAIVPWVGKHVLRIGYDIPVALTGSGDRVYDWVQNLCFLVLAVIATVVWTVADRRRFHYERPRQWFILYLRFVLASAMINYGAIKVIPVQMTRPSLTRLIEPFGDFSPHGVLWSFMGSSPTFTSLTGVIELLSGMLLILPRTTPLGALLSFAAMTLVFLLNLCYDVPVKLYSFHLVLMSVLLLVPHLRRLANVLVFNRATEPYPVLPLLQRASLNRSLLIAQIVFGVYLVGSHLSGSFEAYQLYGSGAPKPPFYGIWMVEDFTVNGESKPPLLTDQTRWQRVIIQYPNGLHIQPMSGLNQSYRAQLDWENKRLSFGRVNDKEWQAEFTFDATDSKQVKLSGEMDGQRTEARLVRVDESRFTLNSRGFHWVQETPFNR